MTSLKNVKTSLELGDGESIVVTLSPSADVGEKPGRFAGSTTYAIPCADKDGRPSHLTGGSRLIKAVQKATASVPDGEIAKVRVTAHGKAGTTDRDWTVELVP